MRDIHDGIDVPGGANPGGGRVRNEEPGRTAAHEDEFVEHGCQQLDDGLEEGTIGISHAAASGVSR